MARRRRRRRNPINQADYTPMIIGAVGGGLAVWLYLKTVSTAPAAGTQTVSVTTPTLPTVTQPGQATG